MSLLTESFEPFLMLDKSTQSDGYGGYVTTWTEGAEFQAAATFDTSIAARVAAVQGVKNLYTITTGRAITLQPFDVIKRVSDEKIFRISSDGKDKKTPPSASLDMRVVSAEEWRLPDE